MTNQEIADTENKRFAKAYKAVVKKYLTTDKEKNNALFDEFTKQVNAQQGKYYEEIKGEMK